MIIITPVKIGGTIKAKEPLSGVVKEELPTPTIPPKAEEEVEEDSFSSSESDSQNSDNISDISRQDGLFQWFKNKIRNSLDWISFFIDRGKSNHPVIGTLFEYINHLVQSLFSYLRPSSYS